MPFVFFRMSVLNLCYGPFQHLFRLPLFSDPQTSTHNRFHQTRQFNLMWSDSLVFHTSRYKCSEDVTWTVHMFKIMINQISITPLMGHFDHFFPFRPFVSTLQRVVQHQRATVPHGSHSREFVRPRAHRFLSKWALFRPKNERRVRKSATKFKPPAHVITNANIMYSQLASWTFFNDLVFLFFWFLYFLFRIRFVIPILCPSASTRYDVPFGLFIWISVLLVSRFCLRMCCEPQMCSQTLT